MTIPGDPLNLIICGVGGQGNILISSLIAAALSKKGYHVTVGDTFGAAQRGGAVFSSVRVSRKRSYGPLIPEGKAHLVLGLEPLETLRLLQKYGNSDTTCITNTRPVYPLGVMLSNLKYPATDEMKEIIRSISKQAWFIDASDIASKLGDQIVLNVIMAGALIGSEQLPVTRKDIEDEMRAAFPAAKMELNLKAFEEGINALKRAM